MHTRVQRTPHAPQFELSVSVSRHVPAQFSKPALHPTPGHTGWLRPPHGEHVPSTSTSPGPHVPPAHEGCPEAPHATQRAPDCTWPTLQYATAHAPLVHVALPLATKHATAHAPQFDTLVCVLRHVPEQLVYVALQGGGVTHAGCPSLPHATHVPAAAFGLYPGLHVKPHVPAVHDRVALVGCGHARPHAPQWFASASVFTHTPLHAVCPDAQVVTHAPDEHTWPLVHARPHAPQLARSLAVFTQRPAQSVCPDAHAHAPAVHTWPLAHVRPHAPQWATSVAVATHCVPQSERPDGHAHAPAAHACPAAHARPHSPQ